MNISLRGIMGIMVLVVASEIRAEVFEGKMTFTSHSAAMDAVVASSIFQVKPAGKQKTIFAFKGRNVRMESSGMVIIFDWEKKRSIMLMPPAKTYSIMTMKPEHITKNEKQGMVTKTGRVATILGYKCMEYTLTRTTGSEEMWVTRDLGSWEGLGADGLGLGGFELDEKHRGEAGLPLLTISRDDKGKEIFRMEAAEIERTPLPDAYFQIPAGYKEMKMGG